jgi:hypothetical protein
MSVHDMLEVESNVLHQLGIPLSQLENGVNQNAFTGFRVTQQVTVGTAFPVKELEHGTN